ncbi:MULTISPECIES: A/G-specific adenine glycosylase [unclassified Roseofilum]|uniref:A/G-specific adenine glycosylase n=1 Tax=unclassified Roseofilum TaxID=2620099 RepID=UPI000E81A5C0|nr:MULTISPECIES: A/G-specific adenine glycosylase [unclassified Roseofilum]HBQ99067.1 A/G-specific adenine glycosylase [Cyanobacteria bacterium UBA11691]
MSSLSKSLQTPWKSPEPAVLEDLRTSLLRWYGDAGRVLPWRKERDPYPIWISEIMLQQTQVKTVLPYYDRWLHAFPTLETLAQANLQQVLKLWEGLGYYSRARNLYRAAQQVMEEHQGIFPQQLEAVLSLPGIGRTTAGGILSAAFNQPISILDGNVKRILARLITLPKPPGKSQKQLWALSDAIVDRDRPRDFNQALMDLGATLCTPKVPKCDRCPWNSHCLAHQTGTPTHWPMRETPPVRPHKNIGVAVIWNDRGQLLIDRRLDKGLLGGLWEFPGGKLEPGETLPECIKREIQEELAIEIEVGDRLITIDHAYTHFRVTLNVYNCRYGSGTPQAIECQEIRWVTLEELDQFPFPKANLKIIEALREQGIGYRQ